MWYLIPSTLKEMMSILLRHKLKSGNLKIIHVGYVKRIYLMLDSYSFLSFLTILFNLIILCYINIYSSQLTLISLHVSNYL